MATNEYIVELTHEYLEVLEATPGRVRVKITVNLWDVMPWVKSGRQGAEGVEWIDGKYLGLSGRAVTLRKG